MSTLTNNGIITKCKWPLYFSYWGRFSEPLHCKQTHLLLCLFLTSVQKPETLPIYLLYPKPFECPVKTFFCSFFPHTFVSQIHVTAGVKSFDPNILRFRVIYSVCKGLWSDADEAAEKSAYTEAALNFLPSSTSQVGLCMLPVVKNGNVESTGDDLLEWKLRKSLNLLLKFQTLKNSIQKVRIL